MQEQTLPLIQGAWAIAVHRLIEHYAFLSASFIMHHICIASLQINEMYLKSQNSHLLSTYFIQTFRQS